MTRTVDCAISHGVDDAVAVRSGQLQPATSTRELAGHVCTVIGGLLNGQPADCRNDPGRFYAMPYRWDFVRVRLRPPRPGKAATRPATTTTTQAG
jgi:hypothetical protein